VSTSLSNAMTENILARLSVANLEWARLYANDAVKRQPVHTVYGGAHLFKSDTIPKLGMLARKALTQYAPDSKTLAAVLGLVDSDRLKTVYRRVVEKLQREAVEDFRIDFEDGFGSRADAEEDAFAEQSAKALALGMSQGTLPPSIGLRIKPLSEELKSRSIRTLDIFMTTLLQATGGQLPENFVVTLPKITIPEQVAALVALLEHLEQHHSLPEGVLKMEIMVEAPSIIINWNGTCLLPELVKAAQRRCVAAHLGPYDYSAACSITSTDQTLDHPACDFARSAMQISLAGTGIWLSDGPTNVMPVGPHRAAAGEILSPTQIKENREAVHAAWKLSAANIRHALRNGFYQGWDLHPAQLPIRYAASYLFFLEGLPDATARLRNFMQQAAQATLVGNKFDDAATGQGLLNYFLRALNCGAITEQEVEATGLTLDEIRSRSFGKMLENRAKGNADHSR
jgi:citrate lyase beta subunit